MQVQDIAIETLKPNPRNAHTHPKKQIDQIAESIRQFGFVVPIIADETWCILCGHGRYRASMQLGLSVVPIVQVCGLSAAKKRALALADNKIAEHAGWDRELLASELAELTALLIEDDLDISITGFDTPEIDQLSADFEEDSSDPADAVDAQWLATKPVSQRGDLWSLENHRILCGDARELATLTRLMGDHRAAMAFLDPPYNIRVRGIVGRGRVRHQEFAMASGELSRGEFVDFLTSALSAAASVSQDGAVHFVCMDWRHIGELLEAGGKIYGEMLNIAVWVKSNSGQGSFYRSQHELIAIFRIGKVPHLNNIELGRHGRNRSERLALCGRQFVSRGAPRRPQIASHSQAGGDGGGRD